MMRFTTLILLTALARGEALADGERTLHFRLAVGSASVKTIEAAIVESGSPGSGWDAVLMDLDGDGTLETRKALPASVHPRTKLPVREHRIRVAHDGIDWTLEIDALRSGTSSRALAAGTTPVHWFARADGLLVRFMETPLGLYATAGEARAAPPLRLGPPRAFVTGTAARGPHALLTLVLPGHKR